LHEYLWRWTFSPEGSPPRKIKNKVLLVHLSEQVNELIDTYLFQPLFVSGSETSIRQEFSSFNSTVPAFSSTSVGSELSSNGSSISSISSIGSGIFPVSTS